jgi:hypothetical protein
VQNNILELIVSFALMLRFFYTSLLLFIALGLRAQSAYLPYDNYSMHIIDRTEIKQGELYDITKLNTSTKAYRRKTIALLSDSLITRDTWSKQDRFNLTYLAIDNPEYSNNTAKKSVRKVGKTSLYQYQSAMYMLNIPDFDLVINPILYVQPEYDHALNNQFIHFVNRGISIRGRIGKSLSFFSSLSEEIQRMNTWNRLYFRDFDVIPGRTFIYTNAPPTPSDTAYFSYWDHTAYIAFQTEKYFDFQFGHVTHRIGNGFRSFMRSDFSPNNLSLRSNLRIWKINYTNIWGYLYDYLPFTSRQNVIPKKYFATTHLSMNVTKNLNIGLFETTVFNRDSGYEHTGYDPQYLNPIIYYNAIDNARNSPDKNIIGIEFKYNFLRHFSLYGQFVLSELNFKQRFTETGWWGNKECYQLGIKYIDVLGISNLDIQVEYNQANPYSYTSFDPRNAYTNYNQPLAHPLGANFRETVILSKWQPLDRLLLSNHFIYQMVGNDTNQSNWGRNIGLSYDTRMMDYNNVIGQGVRNEIFIFQQNVTWMPKHNLFIDLQFVYRKQTAAIDYFDSNTIYLSLGIRLNIGMRECHI